MAVFGAAHEAVRSGKCHVIVVYDPQLPGVILLFADNEDDQWADEHEWRTVFEGALAEPLSAIHKAAVAIVTQDLWSVGIDVKLLRPGTTERVCRRSPQPAPRRRAPDHPDATLECDVSMPMVSVIELGAIEGE